MVIRVYVAHITPNIEVKKQAQHITSMLEAQKIPFEEVDITAPENAEGKAKMRKNSRPCTGQNSVLPPQIFNDDQYCGNYEGFANALECSTLKKFLLLEDILEQNGLTNGANADAEDEGAEDDDAAWERRQAARRAAALAEDGDDVHHLEGQELNPDDVGEYYEHVGEVSEPEDEEGEDEDHVAVGEGGASDVEGDGDEATEEEGHHEEDEGPGSDEVEGEDGPGSDEGGEEEGVDEPVADEEEEISGDDAESFEDDDEGGAGQSVGEQWAAGSQGDNCSRVRSASSCSDEAGSEDFCGYVVQ